MCAGPCGIELAPERLLVYACGRRQRSNRRRRVMLSLSMIFVHPRTIPKKFSIGHSQRGTIKPGTCRPSLSQHSEHLAFGMKIGLC